MRYALLPVAAMAFALTACTGDDSAAKDPGGESDSPGPEPESNTGTETGGDAPGESDGDTTDSDAGAEASGDPEAAMKAWLDGIQQADEATAASLMCESPDGKPAEYLRAAENGTLHDDIVDVPDHAFLFNVRSNDGTTAEVMFGVQGDPSNRELGMFELVAEGGEWKVCSS